MKVRVTITIQFCFSLFCLLGLPGSAICQRPTDVGQLSPSVPSATSKAFHEDWSTPVLDRSTFSTDLPALAETDDVPKTGFIRQRYAVNWRPQDLFDLYVIRPRGVAKPPVILTLYSFPDDTDNFKNNAWCEEAVSRGYAVVGFVSAVTGHRARFRLAKEWFLSEMKESLASTAHDVQLILDYLARRGDLDMKHVGMFGVGSGGTVAILASAVDARLVAVDLLGPWGDWPTWMAESKIIKEDERQAFLKKEFLEGVAPLDPVVWLPKSQAKALRLQDVRHNVSIPDGAQEKMEAAAPEFAVVNEYGNGRAFLTMQPGFAALDWIKDQLKERKALKRVTVEKSERIHFYPAIEKPTEAKWPNAGVASTNN
ncbi:MAG TPA: hypothetical protein VKD70_02895 [Candidatus Acidoferrum sp.]|nr:hypothetical protein [Candidatus Acidoferrum sp.]